MLLSAGTAPSPMRVRMPAVRVHFVRRMLVSMLWKVCVNTLVELRFSFTMCVPVAAMSVTVAFAVRRLNVVLLMPFKIELFVRGALRKNAVSGRRGKTANYLTKQPTIVSNMNLPSSRESNRFER
jgi:hypothetical protein